MKEKPGKSYTAAKMNEAANSLKTSSASEFAGYVFDHNKVFRQLSESKNLVFLTYLLEMTTVEAARIRDEDKAR